MMAARDQAPSRLRAGKAAGGVAGGPAGCSDVYGDMHEAWGAEGPGVAELEAQLQCFAEDYEKLSGALTQAKVDAARREADIKWLEGRTGSHKGTCTLAQGYSKR